MGVRTPTWGRTLRALKKNMDVHFQIVQSIILGTTKEESMGLNSNGTEGT